MSKARELANLRGTPTDNNILLQSTAGDAITGGSGTHNIALGLNAFGAATTGDDNVAIGRLALGAGVTTGSGNIALGITALDALTSGGNNVAIGLDALGASTTGGQNIAIGDSALSGAITNKIITAPSAHERTSKKDILNT